MTYLCKAWLPAAAALMALTATTASMAQSADNEPDPHEPLKQLLQKNSCTACHFIDKRKYGPNLLEVAEKYAKADQSTLDQLVKKMREGGSGVWGEDLMPPQAQLSQEDAQQILKLILELQAAN